MNAAADRAADWASANQRALAAAIARVRARVDAAREGTTPFDAAAPVPEGSALARICATFGLTPFERDILLMCAGPELDGHFPAIPTFGLALAALAEPHWSALLPHTPLRWWRLIALTPDTPLCEARLRIEEPVLHVLAGLDCLDERLAPIVTALPAPLLPESQGAIAERIAVTLARGALPLLVGPLPEAEAIAAVAASSLGLRLYAAEAAALATPAANDVHGWLRLWQRDASLAPAVLLVRADADAAPNYRIALTAALRDLRTPAILAVEHPFDLDLPAVRIPVTRPTRDEQAALWRAKLRADADTDPTLREQAIDRAVTHFDLGATAIATVAHAADGVPTRIWATCRAQTARATDHTLSIAARADWSDLALPDAQSDLLRAIVAQVRHRRAVHDRWGFGARGRNLGVTALFHGPSGTGKSLAAEVVAAALEIDLHVIDLSRVVSKYIGDTERHLRTVFDCAEVGGAALLFDEADALFGARSEVRDSHDRYANIEVSYLLQRMEQHRGLAILTTNMKDAIDTAFFRRIRYVVEFAHPGPAERLRLWQRAFPPDAPLDGIDHVRLAQANFTGAQIHNVALAAAFLAAGAGAPIRMVHILIAAQRECAKLQRPLTQAETAGWA
jgi:hypothetical protein